MRALFILILFCSIAFSSVAQTRSDTITIVKKGKFLKDEEFLNTNQLMVLMRGNREAYELMKKAKTNTAFATALSFVGGVFIGLPLGTAIGGGEPNWGLMGVGAGLIVVSIPLISSYKKNSTRAVEIFNQALLETRVRRPEVNLQTTSNGVGVVLRF